MAAAFPISPWLLRHESLVRRMLMALLALVMTHLITYQKAPFSAGYQFPFIPFAIFLVYGIFICEVNTWNFRKLAQASTFSPQLKYINRLILRNLLACTVIFTVLTIVQMSVFQFVMNPFRFVGLLGVCLMITLIETGVFIVLELAKRGPKEPLTMNRMAATAPELVVLRNNEAITFKEQDVAFLISKNGLVQLVDKNGQRFTTQFESLSEVEERLSARFFRANRQMLVSRDAVCRLKRESNSKLLLQLRHLDEPVPVSRYKSKDLKAWFKADHSSANQ